MRTRTTILSKPIPVAESILWRPLDDAYHLLASMLLPPAERYALFATQRCLLALENEVRSAAAGAAFGLVTGHLYQCPDTAARYCVADALLPLPTAMRHDTGTVDARQVHDALARADAERGRGDPQTLGWFGCRDDIATRMRPADEQLHADHFRQPWQFALLLAPAADDRPFEPPAGAVFTHSAKAARSCQLPFHELLEIRGRRRGEPKRTVIEWSNYVASEVVTRAGAADEDELRGSPRAAGGRRRGALDEMLSRVRQWFGGERSSP